jgi:ABC-type multidrug transport system ATPase subunit
MLRCPTRTYPNEGVALVGVESQKLCDRVAVLEHGRLVALGTPSELTRQYVRRLDVEIEVAEEQTEPCRRWLQLEDGADTVSESWSPVG